MKAIADPLFTSFYLNRPESRTWIGLHAVGSNMPNINTDILSELPLELLEPGILLIHMFANDAAK